MYFWISLYIIPSFSIVTKSKLNIFSNSPCCIVLVLSVFLGNITNFYFSVRETLVSLEFRWKHWRTTEVPLRHIHSRICPLESADKLTIMCSRIQDTTHFTVFFAGDSGIKTCHRFLLLWLRKGPSFYRTFLIMPKYMFCEIEKMNKKLVV